MELPKMYVGECGWMTSDPVLCIVSDEWKICVLEQIDEDYPPCWYSNCSEHWDLNDSVTYWQPLPSKPTK